MHYVLKLLMGPNATPALMGKQRHRIQWVGPLAGGDPGGVGPPGNAGSDGFQAT
jgi:hypothetical protein